MTTAMTLLTGRELDRILRYPRGRSLRLAKAGKLPHLKLPDGEIRFEWAHVEASLRGHGTSTSEGEAQAVDHA